MVYATSQSQKGGMEIPHGVKNEILAGINNLQKIKQTLEAYECGHPAFRPEIEKIINRIERQMEDLRREGITREELNRILEFVKNIQVQPIVVAAKREAEIRGMKPATEGLMNSVMHEERRGHEPVRMTKTLQGALIELMNAAAKDGTQTVRLVCDEKLCEEIMRILRTQFAWRPPKEISRNGNTLTVNFS
ncbi:MAG: hypothetical protein QXP42_00740 [Candidatus Micrarchaeia archaeon]